MKQLLLFSIIGLLLLMCRKKEADSATTIIKYTDLDPDNKISSVRARYTAFGSTCTYPLPDDSSSSMTYDIDKDQVMDVRVIFSHSLSATNCGHCKSYVYLAQVEPLQPGVAFTLGTSLIKSNTTIDGSYTWTAEKFNLRTKTCSAENPQSGEFAGIKVNGKIGWINYRIDPSNSITITGFAINVGTSGAIRAGQKS